MRRPSSFPARLALTLLGGGLALSMVGGATLVAIAQTPRAQSFTPLSGLSLPELPQGTTILDKDGRQMGALVGAENRQVVALEEIAEPVRRAVLAVEDRDFYRHNGVSGRSVARALRANTEAGGVSQGGSTITQQLVKLTLVGNERSLSRKVKEASLAVQLERQFCKDSTKRECKDRILEQYLNTIYLGRGAYGVQAAARTWFGVDAKDLGWAEAALLAALIRNPTGYDPVRNPALAKDRRGLVLKVLQREGILPRDQAELYAEVALPTGVKERASSATAADLSYFERKVRDELLSATWLAPTPELRRYLVFNGGLKVTSTYDPRAQQLAEAASRDNPLKKLNPETLAVVAAVEPATGAVRAVVGEANVPRKGIVEVATSAAGRSPGSSFKTFTLVAAMEAGYSVNDVISANPAPQKFYEDWGVEATTWPSGCKGGSMTLLSATASSNNCAFVRLQAAVGDAKVVDVARRLGITTVQSPQDEVASLTLGGASVRPLEMAAAYAAIANDGRANPPHFIDRVVDPKGKVIYQYTPPNTPAVSVQSARSATVALQQVVRGGTYKGGSLPDGRPAAGKTGTNEQDSGANTDVWFVGFTPQLATAVWIGNPSSTSDMRGGRVQGGSTAARVWREFMYPYHEDLPVERFVPPAPVRSRGVVTDPWGGLTAPLESSSTSVPGGRSSSRKKFPTTTAVSDGTGTGSETGGSGTGTGSGTGSGTGTGSGSGSGAGGGGGGTGAGSGGGPGGAPAG